MAGFEAPNDIAEPEELRAILQHYVEVIEFRSVDPGSRQGEYAIRLFPEVDASFGQDDPPTLPGYDSGSGAKRKKPAPNSGRGGGTGGSLTGEGPVCTNEEKAPRVGFEPTTYRLTAGRSTVELSGIDAPYGSVFFPRNRYGDAPA